MKKILLTFVIIIASLSGFSQSVTILPTSTLGGAGSSQWTTTVNNNIHYGVGNSNKVGIGTSNPFYPLTVRLSAGALATPAFQIEGANNFTPYQGFVKFGGTESSPLPITAGEIGLITFSGSTDANFGSWRAGAAIRAVAKGTFSNTDSPGQLEFATTTPSSNSGSVLVTRMTLDENGRVGINTTTPAVGVLDLRWPGGTGAANYGASSPMLNILGPGVGFPVFVRYSNTLSSNESIVQEATSGTSLGGTNIRWRWFNNSSPSVGTTMFEWANSSFNVTGALSTSGNATVTGNTTVGGTSAVTGNSTVGGTSALTGKVTVGSSTATTAGVEIRSSTSTDANPDIYLKGTTNVLRFGNNVDGTSIVQTTTSNNTPNTASLAWKHISNAATPVATPMMSLDGEGDLTVNGFTKLGETATTNVGGVIRSSPSMKTILLTGSLTPKATPETTASLTTSVPHGLTASKIVDVKVLVTGLSFNMVAEGFTDNRPTAPISGYEFSTLTDGTNVYILRNNGNSANIAPGGQLAATYKIFITYIP